MAEHGSWEVSSPAGVTWLVEPRGIARPPLRAYYATVKTGIFPAAPRDDAVATWVARGFADARWVGPPAMDVSPETHLSERWILSLTPPANEAQAKAACEKARSLHKTSCKVTVRFDLPLVGRGILRAERGNFTKEFDGVLELLSPRGPIEVLDLVPEQIKKEVSREKFGPKLFVVPLSADQVSLVQSTSFANYLEGVVPAEIFPNAPGEALKAQAVVARTYAIRGAPDRYSTRPYLLCATTDCQVYRGVEFKRETTSAAVAETKDLVLRDNRGELAETFYHSICGGHTEPRTVSLGGPRRDYLLGVSDQLPGEADGLLSTDDEVRAYLEAPARSYCGTSRLTNPQRWRWSVTLGETQIASLLESLKLSPPFQGIRVVKRGISGRAMEIEVQAAGRFRRVEGEYKIRLLLGGLLSSLFVFEPEPSSGKITSLTIRGGGYGHAVGMCQVGAIGRAEAGQTFEEILRAYFPGTELSHLLPGKVH